MSRAIKVASMLAGCVTLLAGTLCSADKEKIAVISFGDSIDSASAESQPGIATGAALTCPFSTKADIEKSLKRVRNQDTPPFIGGC